MLAVIFLMVIAMISVRLLMATLAVAIAFLMVITMISVRLMMATFAVAIASHMLLMGLEQWLDYLSDELSELIDVYITALVSVHHVELLSHMFFEFRCADLLRDLSVNLFPGKAAVAVCVNMTPAEFFVDSFLVLLGELSLGDFVA